MNNTEELADRYEKSLSLFESIVNDTITNNNKSFIEKYANAIIPSIITFVTIIGATYVGAYRLGIVEKQVTSLDDRIKIYESREHESDLERQQIQNDISYIKDNQKRIEVKINKLYNKREK